MGDDRWPLVTLGLPVYNGAEFIADALRGLREQTYPNLEILVSDNASTDGTEAICRQAAAADRRIRYVRQATNIGAVRNFELLAREARGELFAWCAHDDVRLPGFVAACVDELRRRPEAVLCNTGVVYLDDEGRTRPDWRDLNFATQGLTRPERAERLIDHTHWVEIYGLVRRAALLRALPFEPVWGGDVLVSMKLLMEGEFAKVDEVLLHYRVRAAAKPPVEVMRELVGQGAHDVRRPFRDLLCALLRVGMEHAGGHDERADLLWRFLRAGARLVPPPPQASWRRYLTDEGRPDLGPDPTEEAFGAHLLGWLAPAVAGERNALALALAGVRRALLAAPVQVRSGHELAAWVSAARTVMPRAELRLVCGEALATALARRAGPEIAGVLGADATQDEAAAREVRRFGPDVVVALPGRRDAAFDRATVEAGAVLGFAFRQRAVASRRLYDGNRRWGFLLEGAAGPSALTGFVDTWDGRPASYEPPLPWHVLSMLGDPGSAGSRARALLVHRLPRAHMLYLRCVARHVDRAWSALRR